ncbi:glycoside hydrolase family 11 protein [Halosimplex halophilum]|uniref:glycoside hydrolase family 11 protein n=1 Tax=Halosimplex halophilum TaxID=2559572 RepID=UPI001FE7C8E4|nr:glycoside hydrolase family 11 protein [Halosimplex halophilum]
MDRRDYVKAVGAAAATGIGVGGSAATAAAHDETITSNQTGTHDGYFYSFWTNAEGTVTMTLGTAGNYELEWNDTNSTVCGLGWETGARRNVEYDATFDPGSNGYLCLYGWTTDPLVEYYIVEDHGPYQPGDSFQGTVDTDGGTYDIYTSQRTNAPSIEGTATFPQYWSIRQSGRTSGTITTGNHFDAWADNGMDMGSHDYQIMATEAYQSTGSSDVSVGTAGGGGDGGDGGDDGGDSGGDGGGSSGDLVAEIDPDTTSASVGERVAFRVTDTTESGNWVDSLSWSLGNGESASGWYADTTYDSAGSYTVELDATNNEGTTTTDSVTVDVS